MVTGYRWVVPDAFLPVRSTGDETSHESICVVNAHDREVELRVTAYLADEDPRRIEPIGVPARRARHLRTDDPAHLGRLGIDRGVPYALILEADASLDIQYSRLDTTQAAYALMTAIPPREETP